MIAPQMMVAQRSYFNDFEATIGTRKAIRHVQTLPRYTSLTYNAIQGVKEEIDV